MKEKRGFDMLDNADERTVDLLSEVPVLTKEEKERMLAMSKKKLDTMNKESNINTSSYEDEVSGVERYKRPKWRIFTTAAACMLLVGAVGGTAFAMYRHGGTPSQQLTEVDDTTAEPQTEHDILPPDDEQFTEPHEQGYITDEEMQNTADYMLFIMEGIDALANGHPTTFEFKETDPKSVLIDDIKGVSYKQVEGIESLDGIKQTLSDTLTEPLLSQYEYMLFSSDTPSFIEKDGNILFTDIEKTPRFKFTGNNVLKSNDNMTAFDVIADNVAKGETEQICFHFVKADGKFKISDYAVYSPETENNESLVTIAETARNNINDVYEVVAGSNVETDGNDYITDIPIELHEENAKYERVIDQRFTSLEDVEIYISDRVCGNLKDSCIEAMKNNYYEKDGILYCYSSPDEEKCVHYDFTNIEIIDSRKDSLYFLTNFKTEDKNADEDFMYVTAVIENGKWKVASSGFTQMPE